MLENIIKIKFYNSDINLDVLLERYNEKFSKIKDKKYKYFFIQKK